MILRHATGTARCDDGTFPTRLDRIQVGTGQFCCIDCSYNFFIVIGGSATTAIVTFAAAASTGVVAATANTTPTPTVMGLD